MDGKNGQKDKLGWLDEKHPENSALLGKLIPTSLVTYNLGIYLQPSALGISLHSALLPLAFPLQSAVCSPL